MVSAAAVFQAAAAAADSKSAPRHTQAVDERMKQPSRTHILRVGVKAAAGAAAHAHAC